MGEFLGNDDCYRKINVNYCLCKNKFKHNKGISYFPISLADNYSRLKGRLVPSFK